LQSILKKVNTSQIKSGLTKHALDAGDSARFSSIFLASSFLCFQAESTPARQQVTPAAGHKIIPRSFVSSGEFDYFALPWLATASAALRTVSSSAIPIRSENFIFQLRPR
jgi:hypothetical protein